MSALLNAVAAVAVTMSGADASTSDRPSERFDLLGLEVCIGEVTDQASCDVRLFPPGKDGAKTAEAPPKEPAPVQFSFFGKTVCLGPVPEKTSCDFRLGDEPRGDRAKGVGA